MNNYLLLSTNFSVHRMTDVMNDLNIKGCEKVSDHSVLIYEINICNYVGENISEQSPIFFKRYRLNDIPGSFLNGKEYFVKVNIATDRIEKPINR